MVKNESETHTQKNIVLCSNAGVNYNVNKILYGISIEKSIDITTQIINMLSENAIIILSIIDLHKYFADPYPNMAKKLIILDNNGIIPIKIFDEFNGKLYSNEYYLKFNHTELIINNSENMYIVSNNIQNEKCFNNADKILYGISEENSVDITIYMKNILNIDTIINLKTININALFGDPYPNKPKKIFVYCYSNVNPIKIFDEYNGNLTPNDYYFAFDNKPKNVYVVSNVGTGGANKYVNDLINHYQYVSFKYIRSKSDISKYTYHKNDIILMQHFLLTDIDPSDIIALKKTYNMTLLITIHDFTYLDTNILHNFGNQHSNYLNNNITIHPEIRGIFDVADVIIHPSLFTYNEYGKYFNTKNFKYIYHNDVEIDKTAKYLPLINNKTINIGILHYYDECKGSEYIDYLKSKYKIYKNFDINFFIVGQNIPSYEQKDFYEYVLKYNLHCLTYLNKWGETHGYCLTYGLNSGLPLIYNNFGSYKERIINKDHYFKVFEKEDETGDNEKLSLVFEKLLDYIIENNGKFTKINKSFEIKYNKLYNDIFSK